MSAAREMPVPGVAGAAAPPPDLAAIATLRAALWANGYRPVPVLSAWHADKARAGKAPLHKNWGERARQNPPEAARTGALAHLANTGILTDALRLVDVDVDDLGRAGAIEQLAIKHLGPAPTRRRDNANRFAMLYRAANGEPPKRRLVGTTGDDPAYPDAVEILGRGQQFVAYGQHASGGVIHWTGPEPLDIPAGDLPAVSEEQLTAFLGDVAAVIHAPRPEPRSGNGKMPDGPSDARAPIGLLRSAVAEIPNPDLHFDDWSRVGMAIWAATGGSDDGFALFASWSAQSTKHDAASCTARWRQFATSPPQRIGAGTLFHLAMENGWTRPAPEPADDWEAAHPPVDAPDGRPARHATAAPAPEIDLSILRLNGRPPPPFPLAIFGAAWWGWICNAASAACCPVDYVAAPLLATASALIGNARWAQAWPGWEEPPHLWLASVGESGNGKSPGANTMFDKIVPELDRRMIGDFPERHAAWKAATDIAAAREAAWKETVKKAAQSKQVQPSRPSDLETGDEPQEPRLTMIDATHERVAAVLATAAPKGVLMLRDELAGFLLGMNAYNDAARAFWLEAWNGRPYRVDRVKSARPLRVRHNAVAWFGGIQPERLAEVMAQPDDGLLARFVWCWPDRGEFAEPSTVPDTAFALRALDRLRGLGMQRDSDGPPVPVIVPLVTDARRRLVEFGKDMQRRGDLAAGLFKSAIGKARGLALRAALVLELLWWCGRDNDDERPDVISDGAMEAATLWVRDYVMPMADRTFGDAASSQEDRNVTTLARWIAQERPSDVHVRRMQREVRLAGLRAAAPIRTACAALVEAGWLLEGTTHAGTARNRVAWPVNPALWGLLDK